MPKEILVDRNTFIMLMEVAIDRSSLVSHAMNAKVTRPGDRIQIRFGATLLEFRYA